ncbi:MAG: right-handed parallel beta-helix repeat-containing protein [Thermoplasmatota archaeon]
MERLDIASLQTLGANLAAAAIVAILAALLALLLPCGTAETPPPAAGDWEIYDSTTYRSSIVLSGSIVIHENASLELFGADIILDCLEKGDFRVEVRKGGALIAVESSLSARSPDSPFRFIINSGAHVELRSCTVRGAGFFDANITSWGIYVHSSDVEILDTTINQCNVGLFVHGYVSPRISGCNISGNADKGVWCRYSSPELSGNRIEGNEWGIYLENASSPRLVNNHLINNRRGAVHMSADSSADWRVDLPTSWTNATVILRGNLTVESSGSLTMRSSSLRVSSSEECRRAVLVRQGGELRIIDGSSLEALEEAGAYALLVEKGAAMAVINSSIRGAGWRSGGDISTAGVLIRGLATVSGSELTGNYCALACDSVEVSVSNTTLSGSLLDIWLVNSTLRLTNVSFRSGQVFFNDSSSSVEVAWHLAVGVLWQNGRGVEGSELVVSDSASSELFNGSPGPGGWVRWLRAVQGVLRREGFTDLSEHTLLARRSGLTDIARVISVNGNVEEELVFTDTEPPSVAILEPADGSGTNRTNVRLVAFCADSMGDTAVELRVDGSLVWSGVSSGEWSRELTGLGDGSHVVVVRATDPAGLSSSATVGFVVDTEPPSLELEEPFGETLLTNRTGVLFRGRTESGCRVRVRGEEVQVDRGGLFEALVELVEGDHEVRVVSEDCGGNSAELVRRVVVDLTPPSIVVTSPPNGTRTREPELALVGYVESGARLLIDGATVPLGADGSFNHTVLLSGGERTIELRAQDAAGNTAVTTFTLTRVVEVGTAQAGLVQGHLTELLVALAVLAIVSVGAAYLVLRWKRKRGRPPFGSL